MSRRRWDGWRAAYVPRIWTTALLSLPLAIAVGVFGADVLNMDAVGIALISFLVAISITNGRHRRWRKRNPPRATYMMEHEQ